MEPVDPTPDALVVRTDFDVLQRRFRTVLILHGVLSVVLLVAIAVLAVTDVDVARYLVPVLAILVIGEVFQVGLQCFVWGTRLAVGRPVTLDDWGLDFQTPRGPLRLPWEMVSEVRLRTVSRQQVATFVLVPEAALGQNGIEADPTSWQQVRTSGVSLGNTGLAPGFDVILPAIERYSQGRVRIV